ncbi:DUF4091 domain-containing protein [Citrus sinensis]|uniref:DUF4091 domain-containing protein n=1 Tax=Citrus sinensis TaxID=2711 RepID=A0ACB8KW63_CITSI|nr:DUF4091 domain-containing protein [Citrus sinensis]
MDNSGNPQDTVVPPVEGVAGGGTAYGWNDNCSQSSGPLNGSINPTEIPTADLVHVWCMPSTANVGPQEMPRPLEPINLLAARNERESVQIALRPKVSWSSSSTAGVVQVQCSDLCSASGDRLVVGQSLMLRRVVPMLGVPDALVPLDLPVCQISLIPGETTAVWVSIDAPSAQPPGLYEGEIIITSKADTELSSQCLGKGEKHRLFMELRNCLDNVEPIEGKPLHEVISDTVIEDRFGVRHGSDEWYEALDQHFKWLLQYRISPFFCRWGESMRVLTYTCPWPADHPKSDEYFSDPRLAAYAVPYSPVLSNDGAKDYVRKEIELLRKKAHWKKAYFYLWDEPLNMEHYSSVRNMASELRAYAPDARVLTTYYCGPSDAPLGPTPFESFVKVPKFLRPHTQIYCTSEWVLGNREDLVKDIVTELQPENGERSPVQTSSFDFNSGKAYTTSAYRASMVLSSACEDAYLFTNIFQCHEWWTYVCMGPSDPHPNWHLGMRGSQHRAVMWRVWKEGGTGFLYWGANCYEKATVPSAEIRFRRGLPPGDGVLFYPGEVFSSSRQPVASLRLERILSGLQDIEYLNLYASRYGRDEGLALLEKTGTYQGPERYTIEHLPIDVMRGEIFNACRH